MRFGALHLFLCAVFTLARACTIGAFAPSAIVDGRPILWKNRDVRNPDQEMRYFESGKYRFVANVYAGETLDVWAGINEAGFAIMNSNSFNIGGKAGRGRRREKREKSEDLNADDGNVMRLALDNCATVDDFARLMDSLNVVGRQTTANYGVFDATGATAIFESANTWYRRWDAADESLGLLVRANYSYAGDTLRQTGRGRHDRACRLIFAARREGRITPEFLLSAPARDMGSVEFDPYPLPFQGKFGDLPYGYIPGDSAICRTTTRSVQLLVGPRPGAPASSGMMWIMLGPPEVTVPIPLWVQGGPVPEALNGSARAQVCDEAVALRAYIRSHPDFPEAVNTFSLQRVAESLAPAETTVFRMVREMEASRPEGPSTDEAGSLTDLACRMTLAATEDFWEKFYRPPAPTDPDSAAEVLPSLGRNRFLIRFPRGASRAVVYSAGGTKAADLVAAPGETEMVYEPSGLPVGRYFVRFPSAPVAGAVFVVVPSRADRRSAR